MRAVFLLLALTACSGAPDRRDLQSGCSLAVGALELCGADCAPALDVVRAACSVLAGGRVDVCQVALQARLPGAGPADAGPGAPGPSTEEPAFQPDAGPSLPGGPGVSPPIPGPPPPLEPPSSSGSAP